VVIVFGVWLNLLIDAVVGGFAGLIGVLLTRRAPPGATWARSLQVALVVTGGAVANQTIVPMVRTREVRASTYEQGLALLGSPASIEIFVDEVFPVMNDPALSARIAALASSGRRHSEHASRCWISGTRTYLTSHGDPDKFYSEP